VLKTDYAVAGYDMPTIYHRFIKTASRTEALREEKNCVSAQKNTTVTFNFVHKQWIDHGLHPA